MASNTLDRGAAVTRSLLGWGLVAGPFYFLVSLAQAFVRDGFDLARHPLSALANGPGGWVQSANLALTGLMVIAAAVGFRRVLGARSLGVLVGLVVYGLGMIVAAGFPMDPSDGFPAGTPEGMPTTITTSGLVHFAAGGLGFTMLAVSAFFMAALMRRRGQPALSAFALLAGLTILLGFFGGMMLPGLGIIGIWLSVIMQFGYIFAMARHLSRVSPDPSCALALAS
jgi:hypothetical protein